MAIDKERKYKRVTKGLFDDESDTGGKKVRGLYTVNPGERRDFYEQHKEQQEEREQTLARNRNIMAKSYDRFRNDPFGAQASPAEKVRVSKAYYDSLSPITRMAAKTVNKIYNDAMKREEALNARSGLSFEEKLAEADRLERSSTTNIGGNTFAVTPRTDRHGIDVSRYNNVYESPQAEAKALRRYAYETASEPELKERMERLEAETPAVTDKNYGYTHSNTGPDLKIGYNGNYGTQEAVDLTPSKAETDIQTVKAYYEYRRDQRQMREFDELIGNYIKLDSEADFAEKSKYRGSLRENAEYASRYADPDYDPVGDAIRYINDKVERYGDANPGNILGGDPTKDIPWLFTGSGMAGRASTASPRELSYIHADEARRATYLYYTQGEDAAAKYLNDIYPLLSERYQNRYKTTNDQLREQYVNDKSWDVLLGFIPGDKTDLKNALYNVESSIASVLLSPVSGAEGVGSLAKMLAGIGLEPGDGAFSDIQRGIRESVQEGMGRAGRLAYGTAMSIADSAFTMAVGAGMQNALGMGARTATETMNGLQRWINEGKDLGLVLMSSSAAVPAYEDAISRGLSTEQACAVGLTAAFAEFITERVSIEAFLSDPHGTLRYLGKNMLAEGSEEVASDLINTLGDAIQNGDDSELRQKTRQYIVMYGLNEKEAFSRAFAEWAVEVGLDGLGGALSGLVFGLGGVAGQMINDARNTKAMTVENNAAPGTVANEAVRNINAAGLNALGQEVIDRYGKDSYEGKRAAKAMEAGNEGKTSERAKGELTRYIVDDMIEKGEAANADEAYNAVASAHQMRSIYEGMRQSRSPRQIALERVLNDPRGRSEFEAGYGVKLDAKTESENVDRIIDTYKKFDDRRGDKVSARLNELTGVAAVDMNTVKEYKDSGKKYAAAPEDNDIVLKLGDVEINADDVVFDDPAAETLIRNARTLDTNSANELVANYKNFLDAGLYSDIFRRVNLMGRQAAYGTDYKAAPDLIANDYADLVDYIGQHAAMMAYKTGMDYARLSSYEGEKINVYAENPTVSDESGAEGVFTAKPRSGEVNRSLDETRAMYDYFRAAAEKMKVNGAVVDMQSAGQTQAVAARILLAADANSPFATLIHEMGELSHLRDPETVKTVRDAVLAWYAEKHGIENLEAEIERYRKAYALAEGAKTYEQAKNELFFDAMGGIFSTDGGVDQFGKWLVFNEPKNAGEKIVNWFAELCGKIADFFRSMVRGDVEGLNKIQREFYEMAKTYEAKANELRQAFLDMVDANGEIIPLSQRFNEASDDIRHMIEVDEYDSETATIKMQLDNANLALNKMDSVCSINVPTTFRGKQGAANYAIEQLKKWGYRVERQNFGTIWFTEDDIKKAVKYADRNEERAALIAVPYVLKRGIQIGEHNNHKLRNKVTITFGAPVNLNGQRGNMAVVVNRNGNHFIVSRIINPDGSAFVFNNKEAGQELQRGVRENTSLANATSSASNKIISQPDENVKGKRSQLDFDEITNDIEAEAAPAETVETETRHQIAVDDEQLKRTYDFGKPFAEQVDDYQRGGFPKVDTLIVSETTQPFLDIGFIRLPFTYTQKHLANALADLDNAHLGKELIKRLPEALKSPIAIIDNIEKHKDENSILAIVDLGTKNKPVTAAIKIDGTGYMRGRQIDSHALLSAHFNDEAINRLKSAVTNERLNGKGVYYWNKEKAIQVMGYGKSQRLANALPESGFVHSIRENDQNVNTKFTNNTETKQFKRWFGDSEVVNPDGTPKIVYHGTNARFTVFDMSKAKPGLYGRGFYFSNAADQAGVYGNTGSYYLSMQNPLEPGKTSITEKQIRAFLEAVTENEDYSIENYGTYDASEILKGITSRDAFSVIQDVNATAIGDFGEAMRLFNEVNGTDFDGVITPTEYVVYDNTQIKSATDNIGTFDRNAPDIRHQIDVDADTAAEPELAEINYFAKKILRRNDIVDSIKEEIGKQAQIAGKASMPRDSDIDALVRKTVKNEKSSADTEKITKQIVPIAKHIAFGYIDGVDLMIIDAELTRIAQDVVKAKKTENALSEDQRLAATEKIRDEFVSGINDAIKKANKNRMDVSGFVNIIAQQLNKQKKNAAEREAMLKKMYQAQQMARDAKRKEREAKTELRQSIRKTIGKWQKKLTNPKKGAYIPREFVEPLIEIVEAVDNATSYRLSPAQEQEIRDKREGGASYATLAEEYHVSPNTIRKIISGEEQSARPSSLSRSIGEMRRAYREMQEEGAVDGIAWTASGQKMIDGWLGQIETAENLQQLNYQQLRALRDLLNYVNSQIVKTVDETAYGTTMDLVEYGLKAMEQIRAAGKLVTNKVNQNLMYYATPRAVFQNLGGGGEKNNLWLKVFDESLNPAQHKEQAFIQQAYDLMAPVLDFKSNKALKEQFEKMQSTKEKDLIVIPGLVDENGNQVKLTHGVAAELYAQLERADNLHHIIVGGFTIPDMEEHLKTGAGFTKKKAVRVLGAGAETVRMIDKYAKEYDAAVDEGKTDEELEMIDMAYYEDIAEEADRWGKVKRALEEKLTDYDLAFIDAVTNFYDGMSKRAINEMSQEMYGFDIATQKDYYPIRTDASFRQVTDDMMVRDASLEGRGNLKRRTFGHNPVLIGDIAKTIQRQIRTVAQEYAYTKPISDLNKLLSVRSYEYNDSVQKAMRDQFGDGDKMLKRLQKLMRDMIGQDGKQADEMEGIVKVFNAVRGMEAQATLAFNVGVTLGQAASYPTAAAIVGWKALGKALALNPESDGVVFWRAAEDLINKYTPLLRYRSAGNPATGFENATSKPPYSQKNALSRAIYGWIQAADKMTVGRLWYAAEYYVNDHYAELYKNKDKSQKATDAYYEKVAEVFNRVVEETQPNYSALQRPGVLRSKSELIRSMTMFMTQRLQNFNIVYSSAIKWAKYSSDYRKGINDVTKADVQKARSGFIHGVTAVLMGQAVYRLFRELADFIFRNPKDWWDEEKEGYTWEQFVKSTLHDYLGDLMGSVPIASHVYDFFNSLSRKSFDGVLTTFGIEQINDLSTDLWQIIKRWTEGNAATGKQLEDLMIDVSGLLGIPLRNVKKVYQGIEKYVEAAGEGKFWGHGEFDLTTNAGVVNYSMAGNMPQSEAFDMIRAGKREEYKETYPDKSAEEIEKTVNTTLRSAVTTTAHKRFMAAYDRSDYDEMLNVQAYMRESGFYDDVGLICRGWIEKADEVNTDITGAQHEKLTAASSAAGKLKDAIKVAATGGSYDGLEELTEDFFNDVLQKRREDYPNESSRETKKKAWESVRTKIRNELRDAYVDAYKAGDREYMREIERILRETGAFTYSKAREQTASWRESYDNEQKKKGE